MTNPTFDNLTIRSATNQDIAQVIELVSSVLGEFGLKIDLEMIDADLRDIEKNYLNAGGVFELIEDQEGNLLGTVGLYPVDGKTCELRKMYFVPRIRGLGLGNYILERTITRARELGFERIMLDTASVLKAANQLYLKYGFQTIEKEHLPARADLAYVLNLSN